jgi:acetyl esterase/lipase
MILQDDLASCTSRGLITKGVQSMTNLTRREFGMAGAALTILSLVRPGALFGAATSAPQAVIDPMDLVDPELKPSLQLALKQFSQIAWTKEALPGIRAGSVAATRALVDQPGLSVRMIPGAAGAPAVRIIVIGVAADAAPRPAVLHIHGGGNIAGSAADGVVPLQKISAAHGCVVVSVDYRLAPETLFPGSLEDNYAALRWLHANARELGVDRNRIALLGESAGGGHVARLAILARDRGEVPIAMQVMIYPMLDDRTGGSRAVPPHIGTFIWTPAANRFGWESLLGVPAGADSVPRGAVPARVKDLRGLPPTFIGVGSIDLFVEEDIAYAQRLIQAGVPTELLVAAGGFHAFDLIAPEAKISKQFTVAWNDALRRGLNKNPAL